MSTASSSSTLGFLSPWAAGAQAEECSFCFPICRFNQWRNSRNTQRHGHSQRWSLAGLTSHTRPDSHIPPSFLAGKGQRSLMQQTPLSPYSQGHSHVPNPPSTSTALLLAWHSLSGPAWSLPVNTHSQLVPGTQAVTCCSAPAATAKPFTWLAYLDSSSSCFWEHTSLLPQQMEVKDSH